MDRYKKVSEGFWVFGQDNEIKKTEWITVRGTPIIIEGYEEFDLFAHRCIEYDEEWCISEGSAGLAAMKECEDIESTKEAVRELFKKKEITPDILKEHIVNSIQKNGLSPRYKQVD